MIWGTLDHERVLDKKLRIALFHHLVSVSQEMKLFVGKLSIQPEHVHILFTLPVNLNIAQVAKGLKGESSRWINENDMTDGKFRWKQGYSAYSVSASQLTSVKRYIENQDEHHRHKSFLEEYEEWARKYGILKAGG